ncbi:MAG TPA: UBP-type zinc finger domain-containing protein [Anaeromyxobacteraceae bacterium]|nr:UBP-type zinc finger domain-containing protein [Anaeromyxobacteraceae bacterium]
MARPCQHASEIRNPAPSGPGCVECLATGGWWVHLRRCVDCGHVGCCDSSPSKHATRHARTAKHPIVQSYEPDEDWLWCYVDEVDFEVPSMRNSPSHPPGWSPGPPGKVPPGL